MRAGQEAKKGETTVIVGFLDRFAAVVIAAVVLIDVNIDSRKYRLLGTPRAVGVRIAENSAANPGLSDYLQCAKGVEPTIGNGLARQTRKHVDALEDGRFDVGCRGGRVGCRHQGRDARHVRRGHRGTVPLRVIVVRYGRMDPVTRRTQMHRVVAIV